MSFRVIYCFFNNDLYRIPKLPKKLFIFKVKKYQYNLKKKKKGQFSPKQSIDSVHFQSKSSFVFFFEAMVILCKMEHVLELAAFFMLVIVQRAWARKSQRHRFKSWLCAHQLST